MVRFLFNSRENRSRIHAQSISYFLRLVAFGNHSRKHDSFFIIELLSLVFAHTIKTPPLFMDI